MEMQAWWDVQCTRKGGNAKHGGLQHNVGSNTINGIASKEGCDATMKCGGCGSNGKQQWGKIPKWTPMPKTLRLAMWHTAEKPWVHWEGRRKAHSWQLNAKEGPANAWAEYFEHDVPVPGSRTPTTHHCYFFLQGHTCPHPTSQLGLKLPAWGLVSVTNFMLSHKASKPWATC